MAGVATIGPQSTVNERLVSVEIVRQVLLLRFSLRVRKLVIKALNDTEKPIGQIIRDALRTDAGLRDPAQVRQLEALIEQINVMRRPAWQQVQLISETELVALAEAEPEEQRDIFSFLLPGVLLTVPIIAGLGRAVIAKPFHGRNLRQWLSDAAENDAKRIRQAIYLGVGAGESPATVARRVLGTAANKGRDGQTQTTRNQVDTIIRSAVVHSSAAARDEFYRINATVRYAPPPIGTPRPGVRPVGAPPGAAEAEAQRQVVQALAAADRAAGAPGSGGTAVFTFEQFVAVLDGRTTKICRSLDGNRYRLGKGPIPPIHMNCRSIRVLVLAEKLGGPIYDPGKYAEWIRRQPEAVQILLLGSSKDNKLSERALAENGFQDYGARPMTLEQVRKEAHRILEFY